MKQLIRRSLAHQAAEQIVEGIRSGLWKNSLPGVVELSQQFKVSKQTIRKALKLLEDDGEIVSGGNHRSRLIREPGGGSRKKRLRIGIIPSIPVHEDNAFFQHMLRLILADIEAAGHVGVLTSRTMSHMKSDPARVMAFMRAHPVDAWILTSVPRNLLEALSELKTPIYSNGGDFDGLPISGSRSILGLAIDEAVEILARAGHRRIVLLCPPYWRKPHPGPSARGFIESLRKRGIPVGKYNLPDWEETPEDLLRLLTSLFETTPPTAIFVVEPAHAVALFSFLSKQNLHVPADVSVLSMLIDPSQRWHDPPISTLNWPMQAHLRHMRKWVEKLATGTRSCHQVFVNATLEHGLTLGPAPVRPSCK